MRGPERAALRDATDPNLTFSTGIRLTIEATFDDSIAEVAAVDAAMLAQGWESEAFVNGNVYPTDELSLFTSLQNGLVGAPVVAHPARLLNTTFQPSATRQTLLIYSVRIDSEITLAGGERGRVELLSDTSSPPTTVQCRTAGGITGTVVVGISMVDHQEGILTYLCPEGHNVRLSTVNEVGIPEYTLTRVTEITL